MSTVITSQSWFSRLGGSVKGIFIGIILVLGSIGLLFWNEGNTVAVRKSLDEGKGVVVEASVESVDPNQDGELVHISGQLETNDLLQDETFGISFTGIKLKRTAEMYQWSESADSSTKTKIGGGTETTTEYSYSKVWSANLNDSSSFNDQGYDNPAGMRYETEEIEATNVKLGQFNLSESLVSKVSNYESYPVTELRDHLSMEIGDSLDIVNGGIYIGNDYSKPEIGDIKITYQTVSPDVVSVISQQKGDGFASYTSDNGKSINMLSVGEISSDEMFASAQSANKLMAWMLRLVGLLIMAAGFRSILKLLSVVGDLIPFVGNIIGFGVSVISFVLAAVLSIIVIAIAWIFYRPILAISLLVVSGLIVWYFFFSKKAKDKAKQVKDTVKVKEKSSIKK